MAALAAGAKLCGWLRELRTQLAAETLLSRPSVRRVEGALADLEDLLFEARSALILLSVEGARDPTACRGIVVDRCREILATWREGMDEAESRKADHERDAFARFMPCLAARRRRSSEAFPRGERRRHKTRSAPRKTAACFPEPTSP